MRRVQILMYHRIGEVRPESIVAGQYVTPEQLESQISLVKKFGFKTISLARMLAAFEGKAKLPLRPLVITFDDGYKSYYQYAAPTLEKYGYTGTVFLVSDLLGKTNEWDEIKGDVTESLMTVDEIKELHQRGHDFGAHTKTHANLTEVEQDVAKEEIAGSKEQLEQALGFPVPFFCYPYGAQNQAVQSWVQEAGFEGAVSTLRKVNLPTSNRFAWGRIDIRAKTTPWSVIRKTFETNEVA